MATTGTLETRRLLAWHCALPLLPCIVALGLSAAGCASKDAGTGTPSNGGSNGLGGSSGGPAGAPASGGGGATAGGASGGSAGQSGGSGGNAAAGGGSSSGGANSGGASTGLGGTGGSAGAAQANGGASGAATTGSGCSGVTAKFCDDFEQQAIGQAPTGDFKVSANAGAMVVDASKPRSGGKSLHIKMAKPGARAMLDFTKQFPFNDVHGRAMMFIAKVPTTDIHWDLAYSYSSNEWELGGQFGVFALVIDPPDHAVYSKTKIPTGQWFCLQWEFKYAGVGNDNSYSAKTDGVTVEKGAWTGADPSGTKWPAAPWKNLSVGWESYGGSDVDIEIWLDDLAFGDQVIPCPAP